MTLAFTARLSAAASAALTRAGCVLVRETPWCWRVLIRAPVHAPLAVKTCPAPGENRWVLALRMAHEKPFDGEQDASPGVKCALLAQKPCPF
jgi:hypothetical protein